MHWVKELNRVFLQAANKNREVVKVPFSMKKMSGSFTGDALCTELIKEIGLSKSYKEMLLKILEQ